MRKKSFHHGGTIFLPRWNNISAMMEMSSPAVAHHLRLLRSSGLIESRRDGKETYYRAVDSKKTQTLHHMIEKIMDISCINKDV